MCSILIIPGVLLGGIHFAGESGSDPDIYANDFNVFYHASSEIVAGRDPYRHSLGEWTPYLYPPLLAELMVPLAWLPLPLAAYVWFLLNAISVIAATWISAILCVGDGRRAAFPKLQIGIALCALLILIRFVLDNFNLGQVNPLVAALMVAHVYFYIRDRKGLSAVALVLAISIKLTPALLLVYHLARLRLKYAAACLALLIAVTAASFLPMGSAAPEAFRTFVSRTLKNEQGYNLADAGNQSLRGSIARLSANFANEPGVDHSEARKLTNDLSLLMSALLLVAAIVAAVSASGELSSVAPFVCCLVLLSPLSWKAHFVLLILPIANLVARLRTSTKAWRLLIATTLLATFLLFNLTSPRLIGLAAGEWSDAHSLVFAGAMLVFMLSVADALMRKFGKQPRVC